MLPFVSKNVFLGFLIFASLLFSACRKNSLATSRSTTSTPITKEDSQITDNQVINPENTPKIEEPKLPELEKPTRAKDSFAYLDAKLKLHYKTEKRDEKVKIKLRMCRDSLIWASFTGPVGIEGLRVRIGRESVEMLDYLNKTYTQASFDSLSQLLNFKVDFEMLQALLLGNMPIQDYNPQEVSNEGKVVRIRQRAKGVEIDNFLNPESKKLEKLQVFDPKTNNLLNLLYENFITTNGMLFPNNSRISVKFWNQDSQKIENTAIDLHCSEAKFGNEALSFPFSIPEKYRKQ
ncbi:MAG: DUF4292 domain-containing protein [Microscillaceae bacterium]|jgi:hypothetical protein|nr:DUF4292 domain-containing protein [Microscillaceae bacterium]